MLTRKNITMATKLVGVLGAFDSRIMQWTSYAERMEEYLLANGVENGRKKVAILLSTVGDYTYQLLGDLFARTSQIPSPSKSWWRS